MTNFVVCAHSGVGKSYLANKLIESTKRDVCGFFTRKFPELCDENDGLCPIYIYPAGGSPVFDEDHLIGLGGEGTHYTNVEVFNSVGVDLITSDNPNALIIMDEIGFLEAQAEKFQAKVIECLTGNIPTVVFLKEKMQVEFIKKLSTLAGTEFIYLTESNRDEVFERILSEIS